MLVCRGCCCGSTQKHPHVDHEAHLDALRHAAGHSPVPTRVRTVACLSACALSNVVVVRTAHGPRDHLHWFALLLDDDVVDELAGWVATGARGPAPAVVRRHAMPSPGRRPAG